MTSAAWVPRQFATGTLRKLQCTSGSPVRRLQADEARSPSDFVVDAENTRRPDGHLHDLLRTAQAERGRGVWSNADPEVWLDENLVGRLGRDGDIAQLVRRAMDSLNASIKGQTAR